MLRALVNNNVCMYVCKNNNNIVADKRCFHSSSVINTGEVASDESLWHLMVYENYANYSILFHHKPVSGDSKSTTAPPAGSVCTTSDCKPPDVYLSEERWLKRSIPGEDTERE